MGKEFHSVIISIFWRNRGRSWRGGRLRHYHLREEWHCWNFWASKERDECRPSMQAMLRCSGRHRALALELPSFNKSLAVEFDKTGYGCDCRGWQFLFLWVYDGKIIGVGATLKKAEVLYVLWHIWKSINELILKGKCKRPQPICKIAAEERLAFWEARNWSEESQRHEEATTKFFRWLTPELDDLKLNFDGDIPNGAAGGGFVIRSSSGTVLAVGYTEVIASNVIEAELQGLWEEVKMGPRSFPNTRLWVEGDSAVIINVLLQDALPNSICCLPIYKDVCMMLSKVKEWRASHIYGEGNKAADWLVKKAMKVKGHHVWLSDFLCDLLALFAIDMSASYFMRK